MPRNRTVNAGGRGRQAASATTTPGAIASAAVSAGSGANQLPGSTLRPVYGERRPVMYHLFETEMQSVSAFNDEALRYFSFGGFLASLFINIGITALFAPPSLTPAELLVVRWGLTATAVLGIACFAYGWWALNRKTSLIKRIKAETVSDAKNP